MESLLPPAKEETMGIHIRRTTPVLAVVMAMLLGGCSSVTLEHPLSAEPKPVDKDKFEGTWLGGTIAFDVRFAKNGVAKFAAMRWKDDEFHIQRGEMIVTEGTKDNFISIRVEDEHGKMPDAYGFLRYAFVNDGDLVVWWPNVQVFEEAIEKKILQGGIERGQNTRITVASKPADVLAFIDDPDRTDVFVYGQPTVLRKIAPAADADRAGK